MMAGRLGQYITLNSQDTLDLKVKANERLRLRIVNTANARIFGFRIADHVTRIMAVDGQPCPPEIVRDGVLRLGPGSRVDLFLDATLKPGARAPIQIDDLRGGWLDLGHVVYDAGEPHASAAFARANAAAGQSAAGIPRPRQGPKDRRPARWRRHVRNGHDDGSRRHGPGHDGGGMGGAGFRGYGVAPQERIWALAGIAATGHDGPPMFKVERGRTVVLNFGNRTALPHAMHVHGHHFRHLRPEAAVISLTGSTR